jgi:hypothetical protein
MAGRIAYYGNIVRNGLVLDLDAAKRDSYPGSGTSWRDIAGGVITGSLINGPTFDPNNGGSIVFDGVNDYVNCGNVLNFERTDKFTFSFWVYASSLSTFRPLISKMDSTFKGYFMGLETNGSIIFTLRNTPTTNNIFLRTDPSKIFTNTWYNIVATYDGTSTAEGVFLYINNVSQSKVITHSNLTTSIQTTYGLNIGARTAPGTEGYFLGNFAFTQIYNRDLTPAEISQNYNATKGRYGL